MFRNAYVQVALTYVRRLFWSVQAGVVTVLVVGWLGFLYAGSMLRLTILTTISCPTRVFVLCR